MDLSAEPLYEDSGNDPKDDRKSAQRAARSLAAKVAKLHGAVPLPVAAQKLLAATESFDFKLAEVVRILESDPALAGRLIRQVNSGATGGRVRCTSIAQAVTLLGVRNLRTTALAASALELFGSDEEPVAKEIAAHASRAGTIARFFAAHCGLSADEMYTCALLHDVGKLMLLRGDDLDYVELLRTAPPDGVHTAERERYGFDHALVAGHVLGAWKLPQPLPRVVAWHHQPTRAYRAKGQLPKMVALVRLAGRLARLPADATADAALAELRKMPEELRVLGLGEEVLASLCADLVRDAFEAAKPEPAPSAAEATPRAEPAARVGPPPLPKGVARPTPASPEAVRTKFPIVVALLFAMGAVLGRLSASALHGALDFVVGVLASAAIVGVAVALARPGAAKA